MNRLGYVTSAFDAGVHIHFYGPSFFSTVTNVPAHVHIIVHPLLLEQVCPFAAGRQIIRRERKEISVPFTQMSPCVRYTNPARPMASVVNEPPSHVHMIGVFCGAMIAITMRQVQSAPTPVHQRAILT